MTAELIAILAVGVSLAGLILRLNQRIDRLEDRLIASEQRMDERLTANEQRTDERLSISEQRSDKRFSRIDREIAHLRERMAHLEGLLEGLREAIGRTAA